MTPSSVTFVALLVTVTFAPGTVPPAESVTTPLIDDELCAYARGLVNATSAKTHAQRKSGRTILHPPPDQTGRP